MPSGRSSPRTCPPRCPDGAAGRASGRCGRSSTRACTWPGPPVYVYFAGWRDDGTLARLHEALRAQVRAAAGRDPEPTAAIIDSQSVRAADTVPKATRGWDNAKKVNGRKRHIAVDSMGLLLAVVITAASVQDRAAAPSATTNASRPATKP